MFNSLCERYIVGWPSFSTRTRLPAALFALATGALLLYPAPIAWIGLAPLMAVAVVRGRSLGSSLFALPMALYVGGAVVGLLATVNGPLFAEVRFFGLLAALATFSLSSHLVTSGAAAGRLVSGTLLVTAVAMPLVLVLVAPVLPTWYLPQPIPDLVALLVPIGAPLRQAALEIPQMGQRYRLYAAGLGALSVVGVGLALGPAVAGCQPAARRLGWAAVAYFASFGLLSASRAAMLAATILLLGSVAARHRRVAVILLLGALCTAGLVGAQQGLRFWAPQALETSVVGRDFLSVRLRGEFWTNCLFLLGDFWFTGVGLGLRSVETVYRAYFLALDPPFFHAHNIFVQSYLEQGLLGLLGLLGLVAASAVVGWRAVRRARQPEARSAAISAGSAALALVLVGMTEIVALTTVGMVLLFGLLGLLVGLARLTATPRPADAPPTPLGTVRRLGRRGRWLVVGLAAVLAAGLLLAALPVALNASLRLPLPTAVKQPVRVAVARVALNLGALELARFGASPVPPAAGPSQASVRAARRAAERRERHREAATAWLAQATNLAPDEPGLARLQAELALARQDPAAAQTWLAQVASTARLDDRPLQFQLGRLYRAAGDAEQAIASWIRAGAHEQLVAWGAELLAEDQPERAVTVYEAAIAADPHQPELYGALRLAAQRSGGEGAALELLLGLADQYPSEPWPALELAEIHARADRVAAAAAWYRQAVQIAPRDPRVHARLIEP